MIRQLAYRWGAMLFIMALIFALSSLPQSVLPQSGTVGLPQPAAPAATSAATTIVTPTAATAATPRPAASAPAPDIQARWTFNWLLKKTAHLLIYGLLALSVIWGRTLLQTIGWQDVGLALAVVAIYSVLDEWHQSFVAGRGSNPRDIAINLAGALLALLLARMLATRRAAASAEGNHG